MDGGWTSPSVACVTVAGVFVMVQLLFILVLVDQARACWVLPVSAVSPKWQTVPLPPYCDSMLLRCFLGGRDRQSVVEVKERGGVRGVGEKGCLFLSGCCVLCLWSGFGSGSGSGSPQGLRVCVWVLTHSSLPPFIPAGCVCQSVVNQ